MMVIYMPTGRTESRPSKCRTLEFGIVSNRECIFPFTNGGVVYNACIPAQGLTMCSTKVDVEGRHVEGNLEICAPGCPVEEGC